MASSSASGAQASRFAARVSGFDMRRDTDGASVEALKEVLDDHAACVVPHSTPLSNEEHIAFSGLLGPMETAIAEAQKDLDDGDKQEDAS